MNELNQVLRQLPSVDAVLNCASAEIKVWGVEQVTRHIREALGYYREQVKQEGRIQGADGEKAITDSRTNTVATVAEIILQRVNERLVIDNQASLRSVINLTGTVIHSNLGRSALPSKAIAAIADVASGASNLEFDLTAGRRGDRDDHITPLICELTGAESATVVNNNAAAVLLVLNSLAFDKQVPLSRGELVEIGGSFRVPEVMARANCQMVEVGTTNRTHLKDYANAINEHTALLMKVHTSNYRIEGFTESVSEQDLATLAHQHDLPMVTDLGSGNLLDLQRFGLAYEPLAADSFKRGVDLITFSGDKLLGGPQCGIIAGRKDLIDKIKSNPLKRALRCDKMTIAALQVVLKLYRNPATLAEEVPTLRFLSRSVDDIKVQVERIQPFVAAALSSLGYDVVGLACKSQIGSGALPVETLPSFGLKISYKPGEKGDIGKLAGYFRQLSKPIVTRIHDGALILDCRCLQDDKDLTDQLAELKAIM